MKFAPPKEYTPPTSERPKMADFINALLVIEVTGKTEMADVIDQQTGTTSKREAAVAHITAIDGRFAGQKFPDSWIFQKGLKAAIEGYDPGTIVLGRLTKPSNAYVLNPPTAADQETASKMLA